MITNITHHFFRDDLLPFRPLVVDAGACHGDFAVDFLSRRPDARIIGVEPVAEHAAEATRRTSCQMYVCALAKQTGEQPFFIWSNDPARNSFYADNGVNDIRHDREVMVPTISLDYILELDASPGFDLVKLDIEGAEGEILDAMPESMARCIRQLSVAVYPNVHSVPDDREHIQRQLQHLGFQLVTDARFPWVFLGVR